MAKFITKTIALGALVATSLGNLAAADDVKLTFLTFETPNLNSEYWDAAIAGASALVPGVEIEQIVSPIVDRNAYARQLDSTGQLPDIMVAVSPVGFAEVGKLAAFTSEELEPWVNPTANSYDGVVYQLATNTQTIPMVYYRRSDFDKAGISKTPETWEEFLSACESLKTVGITPMVVGGGGADTWANGYSLVALVATEVYANDANWLTKLNAGEVDFSDPLFVNAATKLKQLVDNECIQPALLSNDYAATQAAFINGAGAMYPMGSWFTVAPDAAQQEDMGVFVWPSDDGTPVVAAFTGGGLSVSSSAPDVDLAKEWAIAFSTLKSNMDAGVRFDALFIGIKGYEAPTDMPVLYTQTLAALADVEENGVVTPAFFSEQGVPSLLPGFSGEAFAAIADMLNGRMDVGSFVEHLNETYENLGL